MNLKPRHTTRRLNIARRLNIEQLEHRIVLSAQSWNLATDFAANFVGNLPQNNPNGPWAYLGLDGTTGSLVVTNGNSSPPGPDTFGVGSGWANANGIPSYARGGPFGLPANSMAGHGSNRIVWTAPSQADLGGVEITGLFTQVPFEPARQMRLQIFKNNSGMPLVDVAANFVVQTTLLNLPTAQVAMQPGDTLTIIVDGSGPQGNGISTFSAFNVNIQEIGLAGDYDANAIVAQEDHDLWATTFGQSVTPGTGADGNSNGVIDAADYTIWRDNLGNSLPTGGEPLAYTPGAIVVQTTGVTLPDGSQLDVSQSQTHGLQEAFNRSAEQGWSIFVLPGTYSLNAHIDIEELQLRTFRFENVTLNFAPSVTDYGIRFDSTMLTDWYWKGGAINAPGATHGVLYQPRSPHPLDGIILGTKGVVDSRFHWNMNINAATNKVTMNTLSATINDISFYFQNVPQNQINIIGGGFYAGNSFADVRTDDPIPFDIFNTAGRVTVVPPASDISTGLPATVFKPDGSMLNVAGSPTYGLQEAFNYASANNLDVVVFGRGVRNISPFTNLGLYNITANMTIGDLVNRSYHMYAVTLNDPRAGVDTLTIGDLNNSLVEITGQVVSTMAANSVVVRPNDTGVIDSSIRIQAAIGSNANLNTAVRIDPSLKSIRNSNLIFHEVNTGYFGIKIGNPSATTEFTGNRVRSLHTHGTRHIGVQVGESATNASRINNNTVEIRSNTDGVASEAALQVWGHLNTLDLFAVNSGYNFGAKFEPGSNSNTMFVGTIQASTPIQDAGTNNSFNFSVAAFGSVMTTAELVASDVTVSETGRGALRAASSSVSAYATFRLIDEHHDVPKQASIRAAAAIVPTEPVASAASSARRLPLAAVLPQTAASLAAETPSATEYHQTVAARLTDAALRDRPGNQRLASEYGPLSDDVLDDLAMDIGQAEVPALIAIR